MFSSSRTAPALLILTLIAGAAACSGNNVADAPPPAPPAPPAAPRPAAAILLLEPADGAMGGHIDVFRWEKVDGADEYVIRIQASDGRVVWEAPLTVTETRLPATVALEPEVHAWSVAARKSGSVLATSSTNKFTITP